MARSILLLPLFVAAVATPGAPQLVAPGGAAQAPAAPQVGLASFEELSALARPLPGPLGLRAGVPATALYDAFLGLGLAGHGRALAWCARHVDAAPPGTAADPTFGAGLFVRLLDEHADEPWLLEPRHDPLTSALQAPSAVRAELAGVLAQRTASEAADPLALLLHAAAMAPREEPDEARTQRTLTLLERALERLPAGELRARTLAFAWRVEHLAPGRRAPELALRDVDGNELRLSDLLGKVVLVDVWSPIEVGLAQRIEQRRALLERHERRSFAVFGVALASDAPSFRRVLEELDLAWPTSFEGARPGAAMTGWRLGGEPTSILIDAEGSVRGIGLEGGCLEAVIERLLGPRAADPVPPGQEPARDAASRPAARR